MISLSRIFIDRWIISTCKWNFTNLIFIHRNLQCTVLQLWIHDAERAGRREWTKPGCSTRIPRSVASSWSVSSRRSAEHAPGNVWSQAHAWIYRMWGDVKGLQGTPAVATTCRQVRLHETSVWGARAAFPFHRWVLHNSQARWPV